MPAGDDPGRSPLPSDLARLLHDVRGPLSEGGGKLRQPALIMHGDDDPLVPQVNAKIMQRLIPRAKLYIFHDGHLGLGTSAGRRAVSHSSHLFLNRQRLISMIQIRTCV